MKEYTPSDDEGLMMSLALLVARGELSATAYFEIVDVRAERWVEREMLRGLEEHVRLRRPDVVRLLAAVIAVLFVMGLAVALL